MKRKVDFLLDNAQVVTLDSHQPRAEGVAVAEGQILFLGTKATLKNVSAARRIDCHGMTILPGFHDAHLHFFSLVSSLLETDLGDAASLSELLARLTERALTLPAGAWVKAQGYHEFHLKEKRHPTRWELDQAVPGHPLRLTHVTRHAWVLNSRALALAGITVEQEPPGVGYVERDSAGEPTGLILEPRLSPEALPSPSRDEWARGIKQAGRLLLSYGITSFQDATASNGPEQWREFQKLKAQGELPCRATVMMGWEALEELRRQGLSPGQGDDSLRLGPVKVMLDETGPTPSPQQEELERIVFEAHRAGFQIAIHAVEEPAVAAAIAAVESAQARHPRPDPRHRIEHCSQCSPHLMLRLAQLGAVVVSQPSFLYVSGDRYRATVPPERQPWLYPFGSLLKSGVPLAASSDAPVTSPDPFVGIYAAASRRPRQGAPLTPEEAISPGQALAAYTLGAAYSVYREGALGSIAPGKLADFILVDGDPTRVPQEELKDIRVVKNFIGGELVWEA